MTSLFISDLHLDKERPQVIKFFNNLLDNLDADIDSLYILGDFVEFWVGDDDPAYGLEDVFKNIKSISRKIDVYFMHGNRDFMMSESFCIKLGSSGEYVISAANNNNPKRKIMIPNISASLLIAKLSNKLAVFLIFI